MKKSILLFLVLTMIFSTLCGVTVSADGTAASITLSRNKTFVKAVDETASLIVTGLDENGVEGAVLPEGTTFTYESSRPWVLDIADNGKFIDGGYDGTTTVTVTASNGMKASAIFIKNSDNIYADTSYQSGDASNTQGDKANIGVGLRFRGTWINELQSICWVRIDKGNVSDADIAAAKIPGENYYKLPAGTEYTPSPGSAIVSGYDSVNDNAKNLKQGWYKEGLRVMQGWFYDDGTSAIHMRSFMTQHADYLPGFNHISWKTDIKAEAGTDVYSVVYINAVKNNTEYTIKRSKGWHQATIILNEDLSTDVFIDGELLSTSTYNNTTDYAHSFYIAGASAGNFDEFVVAANPNTTKPAEYVTPAKSITLSENKTFITSVDTTKSLVITALDQTGEKTLLPEGTTFTYESSRPWVLDIAEDGKFVDGGYDGTTKVTVTASNGMKASAIFIKNSDNIYADTSYQSGDASNTQGDKANIGVGLRFRGTWINELQSICWVRIDMGNVSEADTLAAKIPGENYYKLPAEGATYTTNPGSSIASGYDSVNDNAIAKKQGWYKEGLRVMQGWFYDDGTSAICIGNFMSQHADYLTGGNHVSWKADIKAAAGAKTYSIDYIYAVKNNTEYPINRSKGWHQATTILSDDKTIEVLIDGELLSTSTYNNTSSYGHSFLITGASAGNFDEFVVAANPNTTKPTVNIDVVYDETQGSVSCNNNAVANGDKVEAYYDGSVNFTFEPKEGYELDTVTYDGKEVTAFIKDGVLSVDCKNAELEVTFKEIPVTVPSVSKTMEIKTDQKVDGNPAALMYMQIQPGYGYAVTETGIMLSDSNESAAKGLKLTAMNTDDSKLVSGMFGIRIYGAGVTGKTCWYWPFVTYEKDGQISTEYEDTAESFTLSE